MASRRKRSVKPKPLPIEDSRFAAIRVQLVQLAQALRPTVYGVGAAPLADLLEVMQMDPAKLQEIRKTARAGGLNVG